VDECGTRNDVPAIRLEWNLTHTATTAIFAVFPIVVVAVLILSGDISDYIGRRATILIGLTSSLLGTALFAVAPSVLWSSSAGPHWPRFGLSRDPRPLHGGVQRGWAGDARGLHHHRGAGDWIALATIVGGALNQICALPHPPELLGSVRRLAILFAAAWLLPRTVSNKAPGHWQPKLRRFLGNPDDLCRVGDRRDQRICDRRADVSSVPRSPAASNMRLATRYKRVVRARDRGVMAPRRHQPPITYPLVAAIADAAKIIRIPQESSGALAASVRAPLWKRSAEEPGSTNKIARTANRTQKFRWVG